MDIKLIVDHLLPACPKNYVLLAFQPQFATLQDGMHEGTRSPYDMLIQSGYEKEDGSLVPDLVQQIEPGRALEQEFLLQLIPCVQSYYSRLTDRQADILLYLAERCNSEIRNIFDTSKADFPNIQRQKSPIKEYIKELVFVNQHSQLAKEIDLLDIDIAQIVCTFVLFRTFGDELPELGREGLSNFAKTHLSQTLSKREFNDIVKVYLNIFGAIANRQGSAETVEIQDTRDTFFVDSLNGIYHESSSTIIRFDDGQKSTVAIEAREENVLFHKFKKSAEKIFNITSDNLPELCIQLLPYMRSLDNGKVDQVLDLFYNLGYPKQLFWQCLTLYGNVFGRQILKSQDSLVSWMALVIYSRHKAYVPPRSTWRRDDFLTMFGIDGRRITKLGYRKHWNTLKEILDKSQARAGVCVHSVFENLPTVVTVMTKAIERRMDTNNRIYERPRISHSREFMNMFPGIHPGNLESVSIRNNWGVSTLQIVELAEVSAGLTQIDPYQTFETTIEKFTNIIYETGKKFVGYGKKFEHHTGIKYETLRKRAKNGNWPEKKISRMISIAHEKALLLQASPQVFTSDGSVGTPSK